MISSESLYQDLYPSISAKPYFDSLEINFSDRKDTYEFKVWIDLAPDLKIAGKEETRVRLDYEISRETLEENDADLPQHLADLFWKQFCNDISDGITGNNTAPSPNFEVTGVIHPDFAGER